MAAAQKVLFGVFDWGLGHATRDTPLIRAMLQAGHRVELLSTGRALKVLRSVFGSDCPCHEVPSIRSPYTSTRFFLASFVLSAPRMLTSLRRARKLSAEVVRRGGYDLVVSDCRYDLYDRVENSILINHQLRFKAPAGFEDAGEIWLAGRMRRYRKVVVPDFPGDHCLSGRLSRDIGRFDPDRVVYIGILSHLRRREACRDLDFFVSLTGPEPQRSIFEKKVLDQVGSLPGRTAIAGGNPDSARRDLRGRVEFHSYLEPGRQEEMMNRTRFFVSRSGYTSLMELAELGLRSALLVPTPGQTEQEYLGDYLEGRGCFHHVSQYRLDLARDIEAARGFRGFDPPWRTEESVRRFMALAFGEGAAPARPAPGAVHASAATGSTAAS